MIAPVILFAYNRADHLYKTLSALSDNTLAKETEVFVFVDGPKTEQGRSATQQVIECVEKFNVGFFLQLHMIVAEKNKGLASSVIDGVTKIINEYGKAVVLEDDSVSSRHYLSFMNQALDFYEQQKDVWSIGGFTIPMCLPEDYRKDIIATQRVSSCAWATWKDRWELIDWSNKPYKKFRFSFKTRRNFNAWGNDRASMYDDQMNGRINSWAIRFDYAMFVNNGMNIIPRESLIENIGIDGSGTHSQASAQARFQVALSKKNSWDFQIVEKDERIRKEFCKPFHSNLLNRMKRFIGNLVYRRKK